MTVGTFFDGSNDWISSNTGNDITADNITAAAMVYVAATDATRYIATWRVAGTGSALRIGNGGAWIWYDGSSSAVGPSATDDAWQLVIVSKAAGTTTPRFHIYNGTSWTHADAGSSNGDMSGALTEIRLGADIDGSAPFSGELATVGLWNETTDDATAETYIDYSVLAAKTNARFFTGNSLIDGRRMDDRGSGNNDETSRQGATTGSQTIPAWFLNFVGESSIRSIPRRGPGTQGPLAWQWRQKVGVAEAAAITQAAYRFYDDGTEAGATALAAQDTPYSANVGGGDVNLQTRIRLQGTNNIDTLSDVDWRLQYELNGSGTWVDVGPATTFADGYDNASPDTWTDFGDTSTSRLEVANSFTGNGGNLASAGFWLAKRGSPTSDVEARLYAHTGTFGTGSVPTGAALATSTAIPAASISTSAGWVDFEFDGSFTLVNGTKYCIALECSLSGGASDGYRRYAMSGAGNHAGNMSIFVASWSVSGGADALFRIYTGVGTRSVYSYDSASLTEGEVTTNRLGSGTGSFAAGEASEDGLVDDLGWAAGDFTEVLYSITLNSADLVDGDDLLFRVARNGSADLIYTATPTLSVSAGAPPVTGTSAQTLDPFTSTATGSVVNPVTGTSTQTLDAVTSTATGVETISGSSAQTLAAFTSTASGTETISGSSAQTLAAFTSTATAVETFTGTSAQTLAAFTSTASGAVVNPITGTSAQTLDAFTSTASGTHTVNITGTSAQTLAAFTSTATAVETISGTSAQTLAAFTSTASGSVAPAVTGTSAQTLADFTSTASGTVTAPGVSGSAAVTLTAFTSTAAGLETISGTSAQTLAAFTSTAAGVVAQPVTGTAAVTLADHTSTAAGLTQQNITGTATVTLAGHTSTAAGVETITGTSAQTLAAFTSTATGLETITGTSAQTLAAFTSTANGAETITGTAAVTLANFTSTATGLTQQNITGTAAVTLAGHTSTAAGTVIAPITGTGSSTLAGHTSTATGAVTNPITGTVAVTLTGHISTATGVETITGSSAQTLAAFTSTAAGIVLTPIVGTAAVTLQDFFSTTTAAPIIATYGPTIRAARPATIQRTRPVVVTMRRPEDADRDRPAVLELARPGV